LHRFRDGRVTAADIETINTRKVCHGDDVPDGVQYATTINRTRDTLNTAQFGKYCVQCLQENGVVDGAVILFADCVTRKTASKLYGPVKNLQRFYEEIAEDDIIPSQQKPRLDPALKLFRNCPVMLTHNADVEAGKCNGTTGTLDQIVIKPSQQHFYVEIGEGIRVKAYYASQVARLRIRHKNRDFEVPTFEILPLHDYCQVKWPMVNMAGDVGRDRKAVEEISMKFNQFPVVRNSATTGHKLQGATVDNVFIFEWHKRNRNWAYVALSRVRCMDGLYIRKDLSNDLTKYAVPDEYVAWRARNDPRQSSYPTVAMYKEIVHRSRNQLFSV
jgi:hypothetical protein